MSQENVEIVREVLAEFASSHATPERLTTPDVVWDMSTFRGWLEAPKYRGPDGFNEFFALWTEPYEDWDLDVHDVLDADDGRVVVSVTQRGRPRGADSWVELHYGMLYTLVGGLVSCIQVFASPDEALEAVGIRE